MGPPPKVAILGHACFAVAQSHPGLQPHLKSGNYASFQGGLTFWNKAPLQRWVAESGGQARLVGRGEVWRVFSCSCLKNLTQKNQHPRGQRADTQEADWPQREPGALGRGGDGTPRTGYPAARPHPPQQP